MGNGADFPIDVPEYRSSVPTGKHKLKLILMDDQGHNGRIMLYYLVSHYAVIRAHQ